MALRVSWRLEKCRKPHSGKTGQDESGTYLQNSTEQQQKPMEVGIPMNSGSLYEWTSGYIATAAFDISKSIEFA
jgi:hypothetical protein